MYPHDPIQVKTSMRYCSLHHCKKSPRMTLSFTLCTIRIVTPFTQIILFWQWKRPLSIWQTCLPWWISEIEHHLEKRRRASMTMLYFYDDLMPILLSLMTPRSTCKIFAYPLPPSRVLKWRKSFVNGFSQSLHWPLGATNLKTEGNVAW